jgi:hypothetical protein
MTELEYAEFISPSYTSMIILIIVVISLYNVAKKYANK